MIKARVEIDIVYDKEEVSNIQNIESALGASIRHLAGNGLLADPHSVVEHWNYTVDVFEEGTS
mgnify:CR=1 FL=1